MKRHHVHTLYAFCRYADDIVDDLGPTSGSRAGRRLAAFGDRFFADLARGPSEDPVLKAVVHTVKAFDIDVDCFRGSCAAWRWTSPSRYDTWEDLLVYMDGSAAVIGEMMLPILEPTSARRRPRPARDLGNAFQLTNFLRDIAEDLDRGRQYVPQEDLSSSSVDLAERRCTPEFVDLMRFEIARCRDLYAGGRPASRCSRRGRPVHRRGPRPVQPDPRPDRGAGLRRLPEPGAGGDAREARRRRPPPAPLMRREPRPERAKQLTGSCRSRRRVAAAA